MKIDMHSHFLPRDCFGMKDSKGNLYGHTINRDEAGQEVVRIGDVGFGDPILAELCDPQKRIQDMDRTGVDMQVLCMAPPNILYSLDPADGLSHAQKYNNAIAEVARAYPDRFMGMATLPLQDIPKSVMELERSSRELGLKGVEILSNILGKNLDDPAFIPFYQKVQELNMFIYVHPTNLASELGKPDGGAKLDRLEQKYMLNGLMGLPCDTGIAITCLIFGGILERFPKLRFLFSHAGGAAPFVRGRLEHGYKCWPQAHTVPKPPSEYFKLLYFDTIAHFDPALAYLVDTVGPGKVVLGTDYPYAMGDLDPVTTVRNAAGISAADKEIILEHSSLALLNLE